jgi:hypothetical protein
MRWHGRCFEKAIAAKARGFCRTSRSSLLQGMVNLCVLIIIIISYQWVNMMEEKRGMNRNTMPVSPSVGKQPGPVRLLVIGRFRIAAHSG